MKYNKDNKNNKRSSDIYCVGICLKSNKHKYIIFDDCSEADDFLMRVTTKGRYQGCDINKVVMWEM